MGSSTPGKIGPITVKADRHGLGGNVTSATITGAKIGAISIGKDLTDSLILAGAQLGADHALGGAGANADTFSQGTIAKFRAGGAVSASLVGAGFSSTDGTYGNSDDSLVGAKKSTITSVTVVGPASGDSLFAAGVVRSARLDGAKVNPLKDPHFFVLGGLDAFGPAISASLADDTGISNSDGDTSNPAFTGTATDFTSVAQLTAGLDGTPVADFTNLLGNLQGNEFTISATQMAALAGGTLADGPHVLHLRAADPAGNVSNIDVAFTLDTTAPTGSANLAPGSATVSSTETSAASVTLVGSTEPGAQVTIGVNGPVTTANKNGAFQFSNVALALGANSVALHIVDRAGNASDINASITRDAATATGDMVTTWDQYALAAVATDGSQATVASRTLAMEAAAVYDVVNAIDGVNGLFVTMHAPAGASLDAAMATAAANVLASVYPAQAGAVAAELAASLNSLPAGQSRDDGFSLGTAIGNAIVALRANDHSQDFVAYTPGSGPGAWIPTGPGFMPAVNPNWPMVTPFIISSPASLYASRPACALEPAMGG